MTTSFDALRYRRALDRFRILAERRLEHMTLLYDTGRWRRYFTEEAFLGIIRETRRNVQIWHELAPPYAEAPAMTETVAPVSLPGMMHPASLRPPQSAAGALSAA